MGDKSLKMVSVLKYFNNLFYVFALILVSIRQIFLRFEFMPGRHYVSTVWTLNCHLVNYVRIFLKLAKKWLRRIQKLFSPVQLRV
jgi:hypothetical protein